MRRGTARAREPLHALARHCPQHLPQTAGPRNPHLFLSKPDVSCILLCSSLSPISPLRFCLLSALLSPHKHSSHPAMLTGVRRSRGGRGLSNATVAMVPAPHPIQLRRYKNKLLSCSRLVYILGPFSEISRLHSSFLSFNNLHRSTPLRLIIIFSSVTLPYF